MSGHDHGPAKAPVPHVLPLALYWGIFFTLAFLTVVTVAVSRVDLGPFTLPLAIGIALIKATLVCAIFMHLFWDHKQNLLVLISSLLFLSIFIVLTMIDTESRAMVDPARQNFEPRNERVQDFEEANEGKEGILKLRPGLQDPNTDEDLKKKIHDLDAPGAGHDDPAKPKFKLGDDAEH